MKTQHEGGDGPATGASIVIKGDLSAEEDLVVTGRIEGRISLEGYALTIAPTASVEADVRAGIAIVGGQLKGNVAATDKVEIRDGGTVDGDIQTPRIAIADGALMRGRIDVPAAEA